MTVIRVAGAQIPVHNLRRNEQAILRAIERASSAKADILLTPEASLSGYTREFDQAAVAAGLDRVTAAARAAGVGLALGTCFAEDGCLWNQLRFYERDGSFLGSHNKILLCRNDDPVARILVPENHLADESNNECDWFTPGTLRTFEFSGVPIAGLVCNDLWATPGATPGSDPYLVREAVKLGAKVVFHAANGGRIAGKKWDIVRGFHEANLRMRAWWFGVPIATVDNATPLGLRCSAPSGVVGTDGEWLVRTPWRGEQMYVTDIEA